MKYPNKNNMEERLETFRQINLWNIVNKTTYKFGISRSQISSICNNKSWK